MTGGERLRVLLLFGGQSAEHDVSRVSAVAVARALDPARYEVVPVGITREGRWLLAEAARAALDAGDRPEAFPVEGPPVRMGESAELVRLDAPDPSL
ncbi:MAG: D-alanine--D-alanine ligase A, partial [Acidimicrobiia bacterium]